jgi:hypothetical protein
MALYLVLPNAQIFKQSLMGVYPYYCHVNPIADHINIGLYSIMIIDPKEPRPRMTEFVMIMNAYDLDFNQVLQL